MDPHLYALSATIRKPINPTTGGAPPAARVRGGGARGGLVLGTLGATPGAGHAVVPHGVHRHEVNKGHGMGMMMMGDRLGN